MICVKQAKLLQNRKMSLICFVFTTLAMLAAASAQNITGQQRTLQNCDDCFTKYVIMQFGQIVMDGDMYEEFTVSMQCLITWSCIIPMTTILHAYSAGEQQWIPYPAEIG